MIRRSKVGAVLIVALLAVMAGLFITGTAQRMLRGEDYRPGVTNVRLEPMPETSTEFMRKHYVNAKGMDVELEIFYRNGDRGHQYYRDNGSLREFKVTFGSDESVRMHAFYAEDGKVITGGFRLRADRTMMWKTDMKSDGDIVTTTFWYDGKTVFAEEHRRIGNDKIETLYYRQTGAFWLRQVTSTFNLTTALEEELRNEEGVVQYTRVSTDAVIRYGADGVPAYKQIYSTYTTYYPGDYYGGGEGGSSERVLKQIDVYRPDGKTLARTITMSYDGSRVDSLTVYNDDGSKTVTSTRYDGTVSSVEEIAADGTKGKKTEYTSGDNRRINVDITAYKIPEPKMVDPWAVWQKLEANPAERTPR
jgi:hypothetical protein